MPCTICCKRNAMVNTSRSCLHRKTMGKQRSSIQKRVLCELHLKQFSHRILLLDPVWTPQSAELCWSQMRNVACFTWTATHAVPCWYTVEFEKLLTLTKLNKNMTSDRLKRTLKILKDSSIKCFSRLYTCVWRSGYLSTPTDITDRAH